MLAILFEELLKTIGVGVAFWICVYLFSPRWTRVSVLRGLGGAVLFRLWIFFCEYFVEPKFGDWYLVAVFGALPVLLKLLFSLSMLRTLGATPALFLIFGLFYHFFLEGKMMSNEAMDRMIKGASSRMFQSNLIDAPLIIGHLNRWV